MSQPLNFPFSIDDRLTATTYAMLLYHTRVHNLLRRYRHWRNTGNSLKSGNSGEIVSREHEETFNDGIRYGASLAK